MKKDLLVTLADKNFIKQTKQFFSSVYWNAGWKGDYMLLAHEIPEKQLKWFKDKGILVKKCKPLPNKEFWRSKHPATTLSKLYLFTPEFKRWKTIIFLDADIIVRASLEELTKIKGFSAYFACYPLFHNWKLLRQFNKENDKKLYDRLKRKINLNSYSFNSGVMIFSTDVIKRNTLSRLRKLYKIFGKICVWDEESILNLFFYRKWKKLPHTYNFRPDNIMIYNFINPKKIDAIVLHFVGAKNRPWNPKHHFYKEWKKNLKKADLINIKSAPSHMKKWSKFKIQIFSLHILLRLIFAKVFNKIRYLFRIISIVKWSVNRILGLIGIFLKKHFPLLYFKIKKIKKKLGLK